MLLARKGGLIKKPAFISSLNPSPILKSLFSAYAFLDGQKFVLRDISQYRNDGDGHSVDTSITNTIYGYGLSQILNGATPATKSINKTLQQPCTIMAVMRLDAAFGSNIRSVFEYHNGATTLRSIELGFNLDEKAYFSFRRGTTVEQPIVSLNVYSPGDYIVAAGVCRAATDHEFFINGVSQGTSTYDIGSTSTWDTVAFHFGNCSATLIASFFWERALTPAELVYLTSARNWLSLFDCREFTLDNLVVPDDYPHVVDYKESAQHSNSTTAVVVIPPSNKSGDLLVACLSKDSNNMSISGWPTGWVQAKATQGGGCTSWVYYKFADGTETDFTITFGGSEESVVQTFLIRGAHASTPPEVTDATGGSGDADPPSITASWGAEKNLFIAFCGRDFGTSAPTGFPAGYDTNQRSLSTGGGDAVNWGHATKKALAATDDPGVFTFDTSDDWVASTVVVRPTAGAGPTLKSASDTLSISMSELFSLLSILSRVENLDVSLSEAIDIMAVVAASDSSSISLSEFIDLIVILSESDIVSASFIESVEVLTLLSRTDDLTISLSEAVELIVSLAGTDNLNVSILESAELIVSLAAIDGLAVSLSEAVDIVVTLTGTDLLNVSLSEAVEVLTLLSRTDDLTISLPEAVELIVSLAGTDNLDTSLLEVAGILSILSRSDNISSSLTELVSIVVSLSNSDDMSVSISELANIVGNVLGLDVVSVIVSDESEIGVRILVSDSLFISISEVSSIFSDLQTSDIAGVSLLDSSSILVLASVMDALNVSVDDIVDIGVVLSSSDELLIEIQSGFILNDTAGSRVILDDTDIKAKRILIAAGGNRFIVSLKSDRIIKIKPSGRSL